MSKRSRRRAKRKRQYENSEEARERHARMQAMRDELNAPDPEDPHAFTQYKVITYLFVIFFPPYALYRIWCSKSEFTMRERVVQTLVCVVVVAYVLLTAFVW